MKEDPERTKAHAANDFIPSGTIDIAGSHDNVRDSTVLIVVSKQLLLLDLGKYVGFTAAIR